MFIANFTPDTIDWLHVGVHGKIEPDDIREFDDARGKHILNKWGQRGLIRLSYEDKGNEGPLKEKAMEMYKKFWYRQLSNFNQHNEALKNENKPYVRPTSVLEKKAEEFGVELVSPWKMVQKTDSDSSTEEMSNLRAELAELKGLVTGLSASAKEIVKQRDEAYIDQFKGLNKIDFRAFVEFNMSKILKWPEEIQSLIKAKWDSTQDGEVYPLEA